MAPAATQAVALPTPDTWVAMRVTVRKVEAQAPTLPPRTGASATIAVDGVLCAMPGGGGWEEVELRGGAGCLPRMVNGRRRARATSPINDGCHFQGRAAC
ncbi:hypothetical protein E2562_015083 [Oryza meyeriana var. granulata]|uniref:Uncharacterized protein n=1 Tax=Oryza meyeriana var. granulata TaxID=110450 RepID=A0A6G1DWW9_9ORYZ|nr:hypothetical protein E2562_015083 [Oryza meyeriana var. granulata]